MKNLKRNAILASIASVSLVSVGCGRGATSIIEQAFEEAVNEAVNERLENNAQVNENNDNANNVDNNEAKEDSNDNGVSKIDKDEQSSSNNSGYLSDSIKDMEDYTVIYDADEGKPYVSGEYKEIDMAYEAIKAVVNGDLTNEILVSDSYEFDTLVPLVEDEREYDRVDKYVRSSKIQMDAEENQKIDVKIREVKKDVSFTSKDDIPHVTLSIFVTLTPEGGDSYMDNFSAYVYEQDGKLLVSVVV